MFMYGPVCKALFVRGLLHAHFFYSGWLLLVRASLSASRTFAAHVIVQFTLRLLEEELSPLPEHAASRTLCGAFIFVCRQLYNTCQGLQVLQPYGLHLAIAAAWRKVRKINTIILLHHLCFITASSRQKLLVIVNKRQQPDIFPFKCSSQFFI